jgi:hypothetical protein
MHWVDWPQLWLLLSNVVMGRAFGPLWCLICVQSFLSSFLSVAGYGAGILVCWPVSGMRRAGAISLEGVIAAGRRWLGAVFGAHLPSSEVCVFLLYMCVPLFCFALKGICPRGNNKVVIIIFHVYDKCLFLMLELY